MNIFPFLPTVLISKTIGILVNLPAPQFIWQPIIRIYCRFYNVNLEEAEYPITQYKNLAQFFTRNLKPNARPIGSGIVSPVDGTLRNAGKIESEQLPQIKGKHYSLHNLIGDPDNARALMGGTFFNYYLSPRDYHHIHAPCDGEIKKVIYQPGRLLPVNDLSMSTVRNLFGINERVTVIIEDLQQRTFALTMIGALNVGKISLAFDTALSARIKSRLCAGDGFVHTYPGRGVPVSGADRLGTFHMGSSVVLAFPSGVFPADFRQPDAQPILMGASLSDLTGRRGNGAQSL